MSHVPLKQRAKAALILVLLALFVGSASADQGLPILPGPAEMEFWRWAIIQGGLLVALLGALWSYRKDLVGVINRQRDSINALVELVAASTKANERSAAASEAAEKAIHRLSRAIELQEAKRG